MTRNHPEYLSANDRRDTHSRDYLMHQSSNLEWWLMGIVLGLLANIVIYRWLGVL